ncbi:hypothetical protein [Streptomyces qaidamensis]|nr:hypothetical protein [Streptomyces qaidamensis]
MAHEGTLQLLHERLPLIAVRHGLARTGGLTTAAAVMRLTGRATW